jgi:mRNA interferase MazF
MVIERFAVFLVALDPALGAETAKTRPCVIVSPDDVNEALATVIIAPMTTVRRRWPTRPAVTFQGKTGEIALDQMRAVDKSRLIKRLGRIDRTTTTAVLETLSELFAP